MDLLNNIKVKKTDRNILIYDSNIEARKFNEIKNNLKVYNFVDLMEYSKYIYNLYYGNVYNPPFFNNIICVKKNNFRRRYKRIMEYGNSEW